MADLTKIEWTDATWNPVTGCSIVDAGCTNCYAMGLAGSRLRNHPSRAGLTRVTGGRAKWTGEVRLNEQWLDQPLRWSRARMIFVCAHGDLFHESVPDEWIDRVFAVMALAPQHTFQVLTKRPERVRDYLLSKWDVDGGGVMSRGNVIASAALVMDTARFMCNGKMLKGWPLPNVWLGTSISDQASADARIPDLLACPAEVRFLSAEPLLGPVDLASWLDPAKFCESCDDGEGYGNRCGRTDIPRAEQCPWGRSVQIVTEHGPFGADGQPDAITCDLQKLDLVIVGGESGPHARPMNPQHARDLRDQCVAAGVSFFFKQWGEFLPAGQRHGITLGDDAHGRAIDISTALRTGQAVAMEGVWTYRVGKKAAGRLLDGRTWDQMPGVQHG